MKNTSRIAGRTLLIRMLAIVLISMLALPLTHFSASYVFGQTTTTQSEEDSEQDSEEDAEDEEELTLATASTSATVVDDGRSIVTARGNHMIVDSPGLLGGPNETFNPMDVFLAGMLTCATFIYETAADELGIPLNSITGHIEADFASQGLVDGSVNPRIRAFRVTLELDGPSEEEADTLREEYMARCPLYTTLIRSAPIEVIHTGVGEDVAEDVAEDGDSAAVTDSGAPPGPTVIHRVDLPIENADASMGIVQMKLAFEPGSWTPPHVHGGQTIVTVLDGEITNNIDDVETIYAPGTGWQEQPNAPHMAGNNSDEIAHVIVTFATPQGAPLTTMMEGMVHGELPPGPTAVLRGEMDTSEAPSEFTLVQLALDFAPGAWTPFHYHGGDVLVTVLEGEMTRIMHGVTETFAVGESWIEEAGMPHKAGNDTDERAVISGSFILPVGAPLTVVVDE